MPRLHVLRVFADETATHGNPLGVFLDAAQVPAGARQAIATRLGFSETVFVDDAARGRIEIYTPAAPLPFAGHPVVGTAWLLAEHGTLPTALHPPAGPVPVRQEADGVTWLRAHPDWSPPMELWRYDAVEALDALGDPPRDDRFIYGWAWLNRGEGEVRARAFAPHHGIAEDEATGSAAVRLGAVLRQPLRITQGRGSVLHVAPQADGTVEVGGRVVPVEERDEPI